MRPARPGSRPYLASSPFKAPAVPPVELFAAGDRVNHDQHGLGSVISVEEDGCLVDFGSRREWVSTPCSKLSKL